MKFKMSCDVCSKEKKCYTWDYIIKKRSIGKVRDYNAGQDIVYKVGGKEVGRETNTSYHTGRVSRVVDSGTAMICLKCRIIISAIITVVLSIVISSIIALITMDTTYATWFNAFISVFSESMMYTLFLFIVLSFTPIMKHLIFKVKLSIEKKVMPWKIISKFWE